MYLLLAALIFADEKKFELDFTPSPQAVFRELTDIQKKRILQAYSRAYELGMLGKKAVAFAAKTTKVPEATVQLVLEESKGDAPASDDDKDSSGPPGKELTGVNGVFTLGEKATREWIEFDGKILTLKGFSRRCKQLSETDFKSALAGEAAFIEGKVGKLDGEGFDFYMLSPEGKLSLPMYLPLKGATASLTRLKTGMLIRVYGWKPLKIEDEGPDQFLTMGWFPMPPPGVEFKYAIREKGNIIAGKFQQFHVDILVRNTSKLHIGLLTLDVRLFQNTSTNDWITSEDIEDLAPGETRRLTARLEFYHSVQEANGKPQAEVTVANFEP